MKAIEKSHITMRFGFIAGKDMNFAQLRKLVKDQLGDRSDMEVKITQLKRKGLSEDVLFDLIAEANYTGPARVDSEYYEQGGAEADLSRVLKERKAILIRSAPPATFVGRKDITSSLTLLRSMNGKVLDAIVGSPPLPQPRLPRLSS